MANRWQGFRTFVKDQLTTPMGDFDPARVWGYSIIGFGGMIFNSLEIYSIVWQKAPFDPNAYGDGLIKVGLALTAAAAGVWIKSGKSSEVPLTETTVVAGDAGASDPNSQAQATADAAAAVSRMGRLASTEIAQANGVLGQARSFWVHVRSFWK